MTETIIKLLPLIETLVNILLPLVIAVLVPLIVKLAKTKLDNDQRKILRAAVEASYWGVEKLSRKTENTIDDKLAEGLDGLARSLGRSPTDKEVAIAKTWFDEMHEKKLNGIYPGSLSLSGAGMVSTKKK